MVLSIRRLARTQYGGSVRQLFLCDTLWVVLAFERCRSSHFGVLTQRDISSHIVSHLAFERTIVGFPLSSTRAAVAPARLQNTRLVTRLLDHQHSELYGEREHLLRPASLQHRVNCFKKSDFSPLAIVGSSFEHEGFCTRSSFEHCEQQSNCEEGAKAIPTKFCVGCPTSFCAKEKSCWPRP